MSQKESLLSEVPLKPTSPKGQEVLKREVGLFLGGKSAGIGHEDDGAVLSLGDVVPNEVNRRTQCNVLAEKLTPPWAVPAPSIAFVCRSCFQGLQVQRGTWVRFKEPPGGQRQSRAWGGGAAGDLLRDPHLHSSSELCTRQGWAGGDIQQRDFGALLLACLAATSQRDLGTSVVGDSGVAKACDSRCEKGQHLLILTTPLCPAPSHDLIQA